ncbi:MAG: glycosyltransferase family 4 protein [Acetobacter sp.]|nr:glycosyltransferase family 4 protein [Bacteroides sp.]MCM1341127.1 glycosyltransferase family 4 protein [Acetobacter sp.]MCM1433539.1 glycosyltransferase family 4 protein [Clostridiales bacterium]
MKIAMIGHKRIPSREGGIEIVVDELSSALVKRGNNVVAYNRKGHHVSGKNFENSRNLKEYNGIKLKTVFTFESSKLNAIVYSILASIRASLGRYDIVHFHAEGPSSMCFLPKIFGKKVIVTIHGLDWQRSKWGGFATAFLKFGEKMAAKHADEVIVLSENVKKYFLETYGRDTVYIPNGVKKPIVRDDHIIKEKFGISKDSYILFLGRIVPEKCAHHLINAYKNLDTDKKLVIAGGSSHTSEYMNEVKELAKDNSNIIFTDFVQGEILEELYSNAYIYCLPSDLEGMPLSLLEAMSYGCCCVTSDIHECTEVCEDNALYFEKGNAKSLESLLKQLIDNEILVSKYKKEASNYICSKFSWNDIVDRTLELYKK